MSEDRSTGGALYEHLIWKGYEEPLAKVPFHHDDAAVRRQLLLGADCGPDWGMHVAVHHVDVPAGTTPSEYCEVHAHEGEELMIIHGDGLTYDVRLGCEVHRVVAPTIVRVPSWLPHSANARAGAGAFVVLIGAGSVGWIGA